MRNELKMIKKIIFLFIAILFTSNLNAQSYLSSGKYTISGSISYSSQDTYYENGLSSVAKYISISPTGSFFVVNRFSVGLQLSYNYQDYNMEYSTQHIYVANFALGPMLRYYFIDNQIAPFIEAEYSHVIVDLPGDRITKYLGYEAGLGFGINYFFTSFFALETYADYEYSLNKYWNYRNMHAFEPEYYHTETIAIGIRLNYFIN